MASGSVAPVQRTAVVDLGSNTFRLVVFEAAPGRGWKKADEVFDRVRIGEGQGESGDLREAPIARALEALALYGHFCRARGIEDVRPVATSAIREAKNRGEFLVRAREALGWEVRVLSREEEARYGFLAAVNSSTITDGGVIDLGGGSLQLVEVAGRRPLSSGSWRLGAVRTTERFLDDGIPTRKQQRAVRAHVRDKLAGEAWLAGAERLVAIGGTVRNLATAAQLAGDLTETYDVQGFVLGRDALGAVIEELAALPAAERRQVSGVKPDRADVILGGALVLSEVLELSGAAGLEVVEAGLREGVFFEALLPGDPPAFADVRRASVENLAHRYDAHEEHVLHVAELALELWDALREAGRHDGSTAERELLWAAAMLHDIGAAIGYDDHHKHSRYLILSSGLPGYTPREVALIAQIARYHRKGEPTLDNFAPLAEPGDPALLRRCAALVRLAEDLDRGRDQAVRHVDIRPRGKGDHLELTADGDDTLVRRAVAEQNGLWEEAFAERLALAA
jgi:exopolyphosphatase / guanosine-5'-triphosphate,3'-diphosphate pyrophosphatase